MKTGTFNNADYYEFRYDVNLIPELLENINKYKIVKNEDNKRYLTNERFYTDHLIIYLNSCLAQIAKEHFSEAVSLEVCDIWVNKLDRFQKQPVHSHANSIVAGILYLRDDKTLTNFYVKDAWCHAHPVLHIAKDPDFAYSKFSIVPEKGKIIMFPGNMLHDVSMNKTVGTRTTIAFNAFVSGNISETTAGLTIKTNTIE